MGFEEKGRGKGRGIMDVKNVWYMHQMEEEGEKWRAGEIKDD